MTIRLRRARACGSSLIPTSTGSAKRPSAAEAEQALAALLSPLMLLCAVAIKLDSAGPVLFRQAITPDTAVMKSSPVAIIRKVSTTRPPLRSRNPTAPAA